MNRSMDRSIDRLFLPLFPHRPLAVLRVFTRTSRVSGFKQKHFQARQASSKHCLALRIQLGLAVCYTPCMCRCWFARATTVCGSLTSPPLASLIWFSVSERCAFLLCSPLLFSCSAPVSLRAVESRDRVGVFRRLLRSNTVVFAIKPEWFATSFISLKCVRNRKLKKKKIQSSISKSSDSTKLIEHLQRSREEKDKNEFMDDHRKVSKLRPFKWAIVSFGCRKIPFSIA